MTRLPCSKRLVGTDSELLRIAAILGVFLLAAIPVHAGDQVEIRGKVNDPQGLAMPNARIMLAGAEGLGTQETETDQEGVFIFRVSKPGQYTITARDGAFKPIAKTVDVAKPTTIFVEMQFGQVVSVHDSVVIVSSAEESAIDLRNGEIYQKTLFERDDQLLESLGAGINAGQHEGGGKSLEIRRFGFNLDHGGVNGGLKVVVNDLPQNQ